MQLDKLLKEVQDPAVKKILEILIENYKNEDQKLRDGCNQRAAKSWYY